MTFSPIFTFLKGIPLLAAAALFSSCVTTSNPELEATDIDGNGTVEVDELETAFTKKMFEMGDTNDDGKLSEEEINQASEEKPRWKFADADTDNSGYLSYEELVRVVDEEKVFDEYLQSIDVNGDGIISNDEGRRITGAQDANERDQNRSALERYFESDE